MKTEYKTKEQMFINRQVHTSQTAGEFILVKKNEYLSDLQEYADQEVARRKPTNEEIEKMYPLDINGEHKTEPACHRIGARWARDFAREEKPNNLKYDWITECPDCNKKYDATDIVFGHLCKPTEIHCSKPNRYIVAISYYLPHTRASCEREGKKQIVILREEFAENEYDAQMRAQEKFNKVCPNVEITSTSALKL